MNNVTLLNNVEEDYRHMVNIKNYCFDKDGLEDMVGEIIIEHDEKEDTTDV